MQIGGREREEIMSMKPQARGSLIQDLHLSYCT